MKRLTILLAFLLCSLSLQAQAPFRTKTLLVNFGTGYENLALPLYVGLEYGKGFSFALDLSHRVTLGDNEQYSQFTSLFGVKGSINLHISNGIRLNKKYDLYVGYYLCLLFGDPDNTIGGSSGVHVGMRYFWSTKLGMNAELGAGYGEISVIGLKLGLSYLL